MNAQLPEPAADALVHSAKLTAAIQGEIAASETGTIPFARFMELAL